MTLFPPSVSLRRSFGARWSCLCALAAVVVLGACAEDNPLRKLEEATQDVEILREEVEDAKQFVEDRRSEVASAQESLEEAIEGLRETEGRLSEAELKVAEIATDDVLFRSVQARLIEELDDAAIAARVRDGVVTLTGRVEDPDHREIAEEIAGGTLGVLRVDNRIEAIETGAAPEPEMEEAMESVGDV